MTIGVGGIHLYHPGGGATRLVNCIIDNNYSDGCGAGIYMNKYTALNATNCTVTRNSSALGCALYCNEEVDVTIMNSILWYNERDDVYAIRRMPKIKYSNVERGHVGKGNISKDPLFYDISNNDIHLTIQSPCIDAGSGYAPDLPPVDIDGNPRLGYRTVDMGADEFYTALYTDEADGLTGSLNLHFVGMPRDNPICLWIGNGLLLGMPVLTDWGEWYLQYPVFGPFDHGMIPANGINRIPVRIPPGCSGEYFLQR